MASAKPPSTQVYISRKPCPDPFMRNNSPEGPDRPSLGQREPSLEACSQGPPRGQLLTPPPCRRGAELLFPEAPRPSLKAREPPVLTRISALRCILPAPCFFLPLPLPPLPFPFHLSFKRHLTRPRTPSLKNPGSCRPYTSQTPRAPFFLSDAQSHFPGFGELLTTYSELCGSPAPASPGQGARSCLSGSIVSVIPENRHRLSP